MMALILVVPIIYFLTVVINVFRTYYKRKVIKVGDICSVYLGEMRIHAFVLSVSKEIEVLVLNNVIRIPRKRIYSK